MSGFNQFRRATTIPNGNPRTWHGNTEGLNGSGLLEPGELGAVTPFNGDEFQLVQVDSGVTSATPTGVVAAGQVAFWKDRVNYKVTNDGRFADGGVADFRNSVAGIFTMAALASEYCYLLQISPSYPVTCASTPATGDTVVANSGTAADATTVSAGTAPTSQVIGTVLAAKSGGKVATAVRIVRIQ